MPTKPREERRIGKRRRDYRESLITRSTIISGNFYLLGRTLMNIMTCSSSSRSCYLFPSISLSHPCDIRVVVVNHWMIRAERLSIGKFLVERLINFRVVVPHFK